MAKLDIKSSNFTYKNISLHDGFIFIDSKIICNDDIESVDFASEEKIKKIKGSLGWGVAGALTLGVVGAAAGLILGGNKKETTFILTMKNGKAFIASTSPNEFIKLQQEFNRGHEFKQLIGDQPQVNICSSNFKLSSLLINTYFFIDKKVVHFDDVESIDVLDVCSDDLESKGVTVEWETFEDKVIDDSLVITGWVIGNLEENVIFMLSLKSGKKVIATTDAGTVYNLKNLLAENKYLQEISGESYISSKSQADLDYYE